MTASLYMLCIVSWYSTIDRIQANVSQKYLQFSRYSWGIPNILARSIPGMELRYCTIKGTRSCSIISRYRHRESLRTDSKMEVVYCYYPRGAGVQVRPWISNHRMCKPRTIRMLIPKKALNCNGCIHFKSKGNWHDFEIESLLVHLI